MNYRMFRDTLLIFSLVLIGACQSKMMLAPTPEVLKDERFNLFEINPKPLSDNTIATLFATTRVPAGEGSSTFFTGRKDDYLHFGYTTLRIGEEDLNVLELIDQSTTGERLEKFAWTLLDAPMLGSTPRPTDAQAMPGLPSGISEVFAALNEYIDEKPITELTIYVHGANSSFYDSIVRGAQFQYFTGDNAIVFSFTWPSPGNIWSYGVDKRRANEASADLAYLIELLAQHSSATKINLLAYSAGGRVVGRALAQLGERYQDPQHLRLGQVYLAASDQPLEEFVHDLPVFFDLLEGLTVTAAVNDPVLGLARITDRQIRLGAVGENDNVKLELDEELEKRLAEIVHSDRMVLIDLQEVPDAHYKFTHGAWYDSPWVSTDVMVTMLGGYPIGERALVPVEVDDARIWKFPPDYLDRIKANILSRIDREGARIKR